jgi:hypothetical protein
MPRPRLPQSKAEVSGATAKNPGRFADRKAIRRVRPLGDPYTLMTEIERQYWAEFARELPWLHSAHRVLLRLTCQLSAKMDAGDIGISAAHALSQLLSKLGATPVDETKVNHAEGDDEDAADRFFSRPN